MTGRDLRQRILQAFDGSPGQRSVVELMLERGFAVNDEGRVVSGGIEIPYTQVADEAGVDRRVVDSTTETILEDPELRRIFQSIESIPSLKNLAPVLGLSVLTIRVHDAASTGVIHDITRVFSDNDVSIRQAVSDDPYFTDDPRFTVVTDREVSGDLVEEISSLDFVEDVEVS